MDDNFRHVYMRLELARTEWCSLYSYGTRLLPSMTVQGAPATMQIRRKLML